LKPWDDLTTFFENGDNEAPTSMNGPGGEVYYFYDDSFVEAEDSYLLVSDSGEEATIKFISDEMLLWEDLKTGINCELEI
jgi:hypothetical protein